MEALKRLEEASGRTRIESDAVIANEIDGNAIVTADTEFDFRRCLLGTVFPGIAEKIVNDELQKAGITIDTATISDQEFHVTLGRAAAQLLAHDAGNGGQVDGMTDHGAAGHARQVQQVVN